MSTLLNSKMAIKFVLCSKWTIFFKINFLGAAARTRHFRLIEGTVQCRNWHQSINFDKLSCPFPCPNGNHHERSINLFYSVGLILLQRKSSDALAAQRRCTPKCAFSLPRCEKLVWRNFFLQFISRIFLSSELCSHWLTKNKRCANS